MDEMKECIWLWPIFDSNCRMIIENVIAGLTRNLLIVFRNWGIAGQARNDEARQFEVHPYDGIF
jgi:hypothetical protein